MTSASTDISLGFRRELHGDAIQVKIQFNFKNILFSAKICLHSPLSVSIFLNFFETKNKITRFDETCRFQRKGNFLESLG